MKTDDESSVAKVVDFEAVFNRNERRVITALKHIVEKEGLRLSEKDVQDAYALSLNRVPSHYVHRGTIVLHPNVSRDFIHSVVRESLTQVLYCAKP